MAEANTGTALRVRMHADIQRAVDYYKNFQATVTNIQALNALRRKGAA